MQCFGQQSPEIPITVRATHVCFRISFNGMVKVGKLQRIAQEEYRCIISYQIPVTFFCIKFHGKTTNITFCISSSAFTGYGREADETLCFLSHFAEYGCTGILCNVMRYSKCSVSSGTFGMHTSFRDYLPVKMSEFFN